MSFLSLPMPSPDIYNYPSSLYLCELDFLRIHPSVSSYICLSVAGLWFSPFMSSRPVHRPPWCLRLHSIPLCALHQSDTCENHVRYHLLPPWWFIIKKMDGSKCWRGLGQESLPCDTAVGIASLENTIEILNRLNWSENKYSSPVTEQILKTEEASMLERCLYVPKSLCMGAKTEKQAVSISNGGMGLKT